MFRDKTVASKFQVFAAILILLALPAMAQAYDFKMHDENGGPTPEFLRFVEQFPREQVFTSRAPQEAASAKAGVKKAATGKMELISDEGFNLDAGRVQSALRLYYNDYGMAHEWGYGESEPEEVAIFHATPERRCSTKAVEVGGEFHINSATYLLTNCEGEQHAAFFVARNARENEPHWEFKVHPLSGQLSIELYQNVAITVIAQPNGMLMRLFPPYVAHVPRTLLFDGMGWRLKSKGDYTEAEKRELRASAASMVQLADQDSAASKEFRKNMGGKALPDAEVKRLCLEFAVKAVYLSELAGEKTEPLLPLLRAAMPKDYREYAEVLLYDIVMHVSSNHDVDVIDLTNIPNYKLIPYTVQAGDTMLAITRKFPCDLWGLRRANKQLKRSDAIKVGETLQVPVPVDFNVD